MVAHHLRSSRSGSYFPISPCAKARRKLCCIYMIRRPRLFSFGSYADINSQIRTLRMPQLTLTSNLALSSSSSKSSSLHSSTNLLSKVMSKEMKRPATGGSQSTAKFRSMGLGAGGGRGIPEATIAQDLQNLLLPPLSEIEARFSGKLGGDNDIRMSDTDSRRRGNQVGSTGDSKEGQRNDSDKNTMINPLKEDVEPGSSDHRGAAREAQNQIDDTKGKGHQSASLEEKRSGQTSKASASAPAPVVENHQDVSSPPQRLNGLSGSTEGESKHRHGKKRAPDAMEGGVAGSEAAEEGANGNGKNKKQKNAYFVHGKVAHAENAARVDAKPPLDVLIEVQKSLWGCGEAEKDLGKGEAVVYWMRMEDMRLVDNRALHLASSFAQKHALPLLVLFLITPGDYRAHDRSSRRIDFMLRNLRLIESHLSSLHIPLKVHTHVGDRFALPSSLVNDILPSLGVTHIFGNIQYEVDELRTDIEVVKLGAAKKDGKEGGRVKATFVHDRLAVPPGKLKTGKGTQFAVYSPWQRQWASFLASNPEYLDEFPAPGPNESTVKDHPKLGKLFDSSIPDQVDGFECLDKDVMEKIWPEGTDNGMKILEQFLTGKASQRFVGLVNPLLFSDDPTPSSSPVSSKAPKSVSKPGVSSPASGSRIKDYALQRNSADSNSSSRMSPYLASGVVSARMVLNKAKNMGKGQKLESGRDTGIGMWVQEVAWRDFYNHVLAAFPRVSMGRPYIEKMADVQWETSEEHLQAWKDGKTGFPIVDAAMRQCKYQGWMHNRPRMICASFLVKDLMLDWRLGERHFMENFIDGDLAANNGGWQWCASTGTDPQPYFRIFNPRSQSETASADGTYIRYWVPELAGLKGKALHDPYGSLSPQEFAKLNYPKPIVDHAQARQRALARYKNIGDKPDLD